MLGFIKQELEKAGLTKQAEEAVTESAIDQEILECAHLIQELDDLTLEGTDPMAARRLDIPLMNDDIEVTSLEVDLLDGRITNMPADAAVQTEYTNFSRMKTFDDFYQEAADSMMQMVRETDEAFEKRICMEAEKRQRAYHDYIVQEGLFGHDMININDDRVPARIAMDFGEYEGRPYIVKLPVAFQVDKKHRIKKKQLDVALFLRDSETIGKDVRNVVFKLWGEKVNADSIDVIWKYVTPTRFIIPVGPDDKYVFAIEFELDGESEPKYLEASFPVKQGGAKHALVNSIEKNMSAASPKELGGSIDSMITKRDAVKMEQAMEPVRHRGRFDTDEDLYQEAIDFGNPDEAPPADPNAAAVSVDANAAPPADATATTDPNAAPADPTASTDVSVDGGADPNAVPADEKVPVTTNDVSKEIADKVAEKTAEDAGEDVNLDATADADVSGDLSADGLDEPSEDEINAELGTEGEDASTELPDETSNLDIDNMTPEELKAAAADKIEKMTFQQIKDFLGTNDEDPTALDASADTAGTEGDTGEVAQEAFFLTRGNICRELDVHLRKAIGILNDNEMELPEICAAFKREGKKCNRITHKAAKFKDIFDETEIKQLIKLNQCISDLMQLLKPDVPKSEVPTVRRMIQAFVQTASGVVKMLESKKQNINQ